jgi:uncharacterized protein involved in exopolysaccharide biosynthesis
MFLMDAAISSNERTSAAATSETSGVDWMSISLRTLWRHKLRMLATATAAVGLGVLYLFVATPRFQAEARLLVQNNGFAFQSERAAAEDREFLATQAEVIHSPLIVRQALNTVPLPDLAPDADPVKAALELLRVSPVLNTDVLRVSFRGQDEEHTIAFIEAVIQSYERHVNSTEKDKQSQTLELLTQRDKDLRAELKGLQRDFLAHHKSSPFIGQGRDTTTVDAELLRQLGMQVAQSRARRVGIEDAVRTLSNYRDQVAGRVPRGMIPFGEMLTSTQAVNAPAENGDHSNLGDALATQFLQGLNAATVQELVAMRAELRKAIAHETVLAQVFGVRHPDRQAAIQQVSALQAGIREREGTSARLLNQELAVAKLTEKNLETLYEAERKSVKAEDEFLVREQQLLENIRRVQSVHDATLTKLNEVSLASQSITTGRPSVTVRLLEEPQATIEQVWPKKAPLLLVCAVLGLALGAVWIAVWRDKETEGSPAVHSPSLSAK